MLNHLCLPCARAGISSFVTIIFYKTFEVEGGFSMAYIIYLKYVEILRESNSFLKPYGLMVN